MNDNSSIELPGLKNSEEEISSIKSMLSHQDGRLSEDDFVYVKDNGFFKEYRSAKNDKSYSGYIVSLDPSTLNIKDGFKTKLEKYMKVQGQIDGLLMTYGFFIKKKDVTTPKEAVVLVEPGAITLSEFMQTDVMTKELYINLSSTISMTLNTLHKQNQYKMNYISPHDVMVMEKKGKKYFKVFGLQNDGPMWGIAMSLSEWTSPELYKRLKLFTQEKADMTKSLTYSFGLVLLYAGNKGSRPTAQRNLNKQETAIETALQQEENMLEGLIESVARNYDLRSAQDSNREKNELFLKRLRASLISDKEKRPGLEVWRQTDFTGIVNVPGSGSLQTKTTLGPKITSLPPLEIASRPQLNLKIPDEPRKTEIVMRLPGSQVIMPLEEQKEGEGSGEAPKIAQNNVIPRKPRPSLWSYMPKVDLDEMAPFSWLVGGFIGMIFIGILTVILLVSG